MLKLGFDVSEKERLTISPAHARWRRSRKELVDFAAESSRDDRCFTVLTLMFRQLYCFFVIEHRRRRILHCNVTGHPTAEWVLQQLREAFPEAGPYRYVILDRDTKFDAEVISFLKSTGLKPVRTSVQAPWQNGIAERWIGSCRRELLDHIIALNESHLLRLFASTWLITMAIESTIPLTRLSTFSAIEHRPDDKAKITGSARVGELHHRYFWRTAA
jgi:transposase InsO family protein